MAANQAGGSAAATQTQRQLRPRQAAGSRASPVGVTPPRPSAADGRRATRSSARTRTTIPANRPSRAASFRSTRASNKRPSPPDSDDEDRLLQGRRAKRARPTSGFYVEADTDGDDNDDDVDDSEDDQDGDDVFASRPQRRSTRQASLNPARITRRSHAQTQAQAQVQVQTRQRTPPPRRSPSMKKKPAKKTLTPLRIPKPAPLPAGNDPNVVIPNWPALPYFVWVNIFECAAGLLEEGQATNWLLSMSRVCRTFCEPALTALYKNPPLETWNKIQGLTQLLEKDPATTAFNYRSKILKLQIDVQVAGATHKSKGIDWPALVGNLPRLQTIDFPHVKDRPPFRNLDDTLRWSYPAELFNALDGEPASRPPVKLGAWCWNQRLLPPDGFPARVRELHQTPAFSNLKRLSFINYQVPSLHMPEGVSEEDALAADCAFIQNVANAILELPDLDFLSFTASTVVNDLLLGQLPSRLQTLELINCWEVNSKDFSDFLLSRGSHLRHLRLEYNQSLDLSFVTVLGEACPDLESLIMDFKIFRHHEWYRDNNPNYVAVLHVGDVPNWPASLQTLELKNMRQWESAAAETLFQSLVDSAVRLPLLRHLHLKMMLNIPFRERSAIRDKWEARLKHVFLRQTEDPRPVYTLRQLPPGTPDGPTPNWKVSSGARGSSKGIANKKTRHQAAKESPSRRSSRIAGQGLPSGPSSRASSVGRDLRAGQTRGFYTEISTDEEDNEEEEEDDGDGGKLADPFSPAASQEGHQAEIFRQGMCDVVEVQIDNQKPVEIEWEMNDFLDEVSSDDHSDEDWNGDVDEGEASYAW